MTGIADPIAFDPARARRYSPLKVLKIAKVVDVPAGRRSTIAAEWGEEQTFVGRYFQVLDLSTGIIRYGAAYDEWMNTHRPWPGVQNGWYKTTPVDAYQTDEEGVVVTVLASGVSETSKHVRVGDWLVRHRDGEVTAIDAGTFPALYDVASSGRP